ncbi:DUF7411 family protein [Methanocaldococcus infernus]|uniref:Subunit of tRNA(5-methylaminomethyl-2-thiouridylate) methyltransferase n=1 Tax=Methanocaldococcus infernus (strain DSM 11812 / JCM 15783 / ME) TaxID=573063 RepID=D5VR32_METIM|nr:7-cyano-7-deazaguanine synthase [Methanocaldococcus infernus]ADG13035.1 subunit of tRNA(5-methylaminomethyl-2-thiouridylate) methyltransferase [Methanocaldococcus infernus ME]
MVYLLFSGGKDSSLAALILKKLGYDVKLITVNFGVIDSYKLAEETAKILGFEHRVEYLDKSILEEGVSLILKHGYPAEGINYIHKKVLETLADKYKVLADGIRRDDKVPKLTYSEIQSLEMRKNIQYISPLLGFGHKTIKDLINRFFIIEEIKSGTKITSDYEAEIRSYMKMIGEDPNKYFPEHKQSRVVGVRNWEV